MAKAVSMPAAFDVLRTFISFSVSKFEWLRRLKADAVYMFGACWLEG
jgi:hypothetical protein